MFEDKQLDTLVWDYGEREEGEVPSYAADFETTTLADDCRVWAWAVSAEEKVRTINEVSGTKNVFG